MKKEILPFAKFITITLSILVSISFIFIPIISILGDSKSIFEYVLEYIKYLGADAFSISTVTQLTVISVLIVILSICIIIFNLIKYKKVLKILSIIFSAIQLIIPLTIIIYIRSEMSSNLGQISSKWLKTGNIKIGLILTLVFSFLELIFSILSLLYKRLDNSYMPINQSNYVNTNITSEPYCRLVFISGELYGKEIKILTGKEIVIGRDATYSNIILNNININPKHFSIIYNSYNSSYTVINYSQNGIFINNVLLQGNAKIEVPINTIISIQQTEDAIKLSL